MCLRSFPELDRAVEWCENQILLAEGADLEGDVRPLPDLLAEALPELDPTLMARYFERQEIAAGHYLMRQGDPAQDLFFVESGQVTVQMELDDGSTVRLLTMGAGTLEPRRVEGIASEGMRLSSPVHAKNLG